MAEAASTGGTPDGGHGRWPAFVGHFASAAVAAADLAGFGARVRVDDPPAVRAELRRIARELLEADSPG